LLLFCDLCFFFLLSDVVNFLFSFSYVFPISYCSFRVILCSVCNHRVFHMFALCNVIDKVLCLFSVFMCVIVLVHILFSSAVLFAVVFLLLNYCFCYLLLFLHTLALFL
jgi:hypothetical protein